MDSRDPRDETTPVAGTEPMPGAGGMPGAARLPGTQDAFNPWNYRPDAGWTPEYDLMGYHVEATDGHMGKVDQANQAMDESYLVIDTGPWIFGKKVLLPAGTVTHIDHTDRKVYVDRTKQQVKASPEFDPDMFDEPTYRDKVGGYYGTTYDSGVIRGFGQ